MKLRSYILLITVCVFLNTFVNAQCYTHTITSKKQFESFSGLPLSDKYGQVISIKIVYEFKSKQLYYVHSNCYKYHFGFCSTQLGFRKGLEIFNDINYSNKPQKEYLLANLNFYKTLNKYVLELFPGDLMTTEEILRLYTLVSNSGYWNNSLYFFINSTRLQNEKSKLSTVPLIEASDIYKGLTYQAVSKYSNTGNLRFIQNLENEISSIKPTDIIVIQETPLVLPIVAGIIVTEFQTPLSHLTILGQNRKIPIAAYKNAFSDSLLLQQSNSRIRFQVQVDTFSIKPDTNTFTKKHVPKISIKSDLSVDTLIGVKYMSNNSCKYVGNKAANFGLLCQLSNKASFKTPENAFAIPFYFYNEHFKKSGAQHILNQLLLDTLLLNNQDSVKVYLQRVQKCIEQFPVDTQLLKRINQRMGTDTLTTNYRFRSSTNAEDAQGFSGAGLYTSKTGIKNNASKSISKALTKVWASLWSYQAFVEREYYNIQHNQVYMGVLVHRSFPNEAVNGVAITKNLYRNGMPGFVVNAQIGNESVVKPKTGVVCDQFICYPYNSNFTLENKNTIEIITQSSLSSQGLVMTDAEIQNLANQLEIIKKYFYSHTYTERSYEDFGLDIEFKIDGATRDLYIKQVRLYND